MKAAPLSKKQEKSLCLLIVRSDIAAHLRILHLTEQKNNGPRLRKTIIGMSTEDYTIHCTNEDIAKS